MIIVAFSTSPVAIVINTTLALEYGRVGVLYCQLKYCFVNKGTNRYGVIGEIFGFVFIGLKEKIVSDFLQHRIGAYEERKS